MIIDKNEVVKMITMDTIEREEVKWLWEPYIPYGKITIVQGDPGEGKTSFVLKLAAELSNGRCFDDKEGESTREPINIIYQTAEDGLADTVKPRLEDAGADCSRILVIDDSDESLSLQDLRIEKAIKQTGAKPIILDPIQAFLGDRVDMNRANETRDMTKKITAIAERTGCAVVFVGHMNKGSGAKAAYRGVGSIDFFAVARCVLLVARVPSHNDIRAVAQIKNNITREANTVAFQFKDGGFNWIGEYEITALELLNGYVSGGKSSKAEDFLKNLLEEHQTYPVNEIYQQGQAIGISKRTIENVKQQLGVKSHRVGSVWHWSLV